jgi:YD repeat-containing protein
MKRMSKDRSGRSGSWSRMGLPCLLAVALLCAAAMGGYIPDPDPLPPPEEERPECEFDGCKWTCNATSNPVVYATGEKCWHYAEWAMGDKDPGNRLSNRPSPIPGSCPQGRYCILPVVPVPNHRLVGGTYEGPFGNNLLSGPYVAGTMGATVAVVFPGRSAIWFDWNGSSYVPRHTSTSSSLQHDSGNKTFTYQTSSSGMLQVAQTHEFYDLSWGDFRRGRFKRTPGMNGSEVTAEGSGGIPLEKQQMVSAGGVTSIHSEVYSYYAGGEHARRLESTTTRRKVGTGDWVDLRRVVFTYYGTGEPHGNLGDQKTMTMQVPDGSGGWTDVAVTYRRYWKETKENGYASAIKYELGPEGWRRLTAASVNPLTATDQQIGAVADYYFEYDEEGRIIKEVAAAGCGSCSGPGGGTQGITFVRETNPSYPGMPADRYNAWKTKVTVTHPDGNQEIVYTNDLAQVMLKVYEEAGSDPVRWWYEYSRYDDRGRIILEAASPAVTGFDEEELDLDVQLAANDGLIRIKQYYTSTNLGAGAVKDYLMAENIRRGEAGTDVKLREYQYTTHTGSSQTITLIAKRIVYPDETDDEVTIETSFAYEFHSGTTDIKQRTTTLPAVGSGQNGSGTSATRVEVLDQYGNVVWLRDERGFITRNVFDVGRGLLMQRIDDVDTTAVGDEPDGWETPAGGGAHLVTDYEYDEVNRLVQVLHPVHQAVVGGSAVTVRQAEWTVYHESLSGDEVWTGRGYATGTGPSYTYALVGPVQIRKLDKAGRDVETIVSKRSSGSGRLAATDTFNRADWVRWTVENYNDRGERTWVRAYHLIPGSGTGAAGTNYAQTSFGYDVMGRTIRTVSAGGSIARTVYDSRGKLISVWSGTDDDGATATNPAGSGGTNNMVKVAEAEYDGGSAGGAGNLTKVTQYAGATDLRITEAEYDWRNRLVAVSGEEDVYVQGFYDNLNRIVKVDRRETDDSGNLIGRQEIMYDDRGRVYRTIMHEVDPSDGSLGESLVSNNWYDASGNLIKSVEAGDGSVFSKLAYDGLGRALKLYIGYDLSETSYADAGTVSDDTIVEQFELAYDAAGNVIQITSRERLHDATGAGELTTIGGSQPKARVSYEAAWYDGVGRPVAAAMYGTNGDASLTRPGTAPARSDTVLVQSVVSVRRSTRVNGGWRWRVGG